MTEKKVSIVWVVVVGVICLIGGSWITQVYMTPGMNVEQRLKLRVVTKECTDGVGKVRQNCIYAEKRRRFDEQ